MDLRKAQCTVQKVANQYASVFSVKWNDIYKTEEDIVNDLKLIHVPDEKDMRNISYLYKGYDFIHSFAKQVQAGKTLSGKQMTQCKRLALEIKKAVSIRDCF